MVAAVGAGMSAASPVMRLATPCTFERPRSAVPARSRRAVRGTEPRGVVALEWPCGARTTGARRP